MTSRTTRARLAVLLATAALAAGCGPSSATPTASSSAAARTKPNIQAFLELPVASPSACPSGSNGTTIGRLSPWSGHVDVSVFLSTSATGAQIAAIGRELRSQPLVATVYRESSAEAFAEFERLYTCWAGVSRQDVPSSYRLILRPGVTTATRNGLVQQLVDSPGVDSVSCDPSSPCTSVVRSATPGTSS